MNLLFICTHNRCRSILCEAIASQRGAGSLIGGIADTREMMQFAHNHGLGAEIELTQPDEIETAWHRLHEGDVHHRFVIDLASLGSG